MQIRLHLNPEGWRGWVAGLVGGGLGIATIQLPQPSFAGTWAELDIIKAKIIYIVLQLP